MPIFRWGNRHPSPFEKGGIQGGTVIPAKAGIQVDFEVPSFRRKPESRGVGQGRIGIGVPTCRRKTQKATIKTAMVPDNLLSEIHLSEVLNSIAYRA